MLVAVCSQYLEVGFILISSLLGLLHLLIHLGKAVAEHVAGLV